MNLELSMILQQVDRLIDCFNYVVLKHIYWERNSYADVLAKAGGMILDGYWSIKEYRADEVVETFHIF